MFEFLKKKFRKTVDKFEKEAEKKIEEKPKLEQVEKKKWYNKIVSTQISERDFDKLFEELEITLLENNLALIKVEEAGLPTVGFAEFGSLRFGQRVFLAGAI